MTGHESREALLGMLAGPLADKGLDLEDVQLTGAGRRRIIRVLIDKDGGVSLDDIADATTDVSAALDHEDVLGNASYTLEVTSPGVDRPLSLPRHWRRNVDRLVKVTPRVGEPFTARIAAADDSGATVEVDGVETELTYDDIVKARVEIEFNRPTGVGKGERSSGRVHQTSDDRAGHPFAGRDDEDRE